MSLFFDLPRDLYNEVCCEWLKTVDLGKLDSAMCQSKYRESLLQQLQDKQMEYSLEEESASFYNWMYARNIPLKTLRVNEKLFVSGMFQCRIRFLQVQTLHVGNLMNIDSSILEQVVGACTNVTALDWNDSVHILNDCVSVKTLTFLTIRLSLCTFERYCHWIIEHCSKLHTLEIREVLSGYGLNAVQRSLLNTAINMNSSTLRVLRLYSIGIPSEIFNCPNLTDLIINAPIRWSDVDLYISKLVTMNFTINGIEFNVHESSLIIDGCYISEHVLCRFLTNFNGLKAITIQCGPFTDNLCNTIVDRFSATLIHLCVCIQNFTSQALQHLFASCEGLESFEQSAVGLLLTSRDTCNTIINMRPSSLKNLCILTLSDCSDLMIELLTSVPSLICLKVKYVKESQQLKMLTEFVESEQQRGRDITIVYGY